MNPGVISKGFFPCKLYIRHVRAGDLEPAEDGRHPLLQVVPAPVGAVRHLLEAAASVRAVFSGQPAILLVQQFQLRQAFVDLPLESLRTCGRGKVRNVKRRFEEFFILVWIASAFFFFPLTTDR